MKTLSVRQPWAALIIFGGKNIENRSWATKYTGPILIHAAASMTRVEYAECCRFCEEHDLESPARLDLRLGGIIGRVTVTDYTTNPQCSPWFMGPIGWILKGPVALPFAPCKGKLGLWEYAELDNQTEGRK